MIPLLAVNTTKTILGKKISGITFGVSLTDYLSFKRLCKISCLVLIMNKQMNKGNSLVSQKI